MSKPLENLPEDNEFEEDTVSYDNDYYYEAYVLYDRLLETCQGDFLRGKRGCNIRAIS